ncbi:MAG: DUF3820 family protein [Verrucomicrobiota bacterium]
MAEGERMMDGLKVDLAAYFADLETYRMPFGKFGPERRPPDGLRVVERPWEYLHWFLERGGGFPKGRLGELMEFVYEVKGSGAGEVLAPLLEGQQGRVES